MKQKIADTMANIPIYFHMFCIVIAGSLLFLDICCIYSTGSGLTWWLSLVIVLWAVVAGFAVQLKINQKKKMDWEKLDKYDDIIKWGVVMALIACGILGFISK